jgi:tetratricopeptide (TPR) repeat protein
VELLRPDPNAEPHSQAIIYWAHAVAAGHTGNLQSAQQAVDGYNKMVQATEKGPQAYRAKYMSTQHDEALAWLDLLQGKDMEATDLLRAIADRQDTEGKGEIELPAREMLADMLLLMKRPKEALVEFEQVMKIDPKRFNALYGAGEAAEMLGERDKERANYGQLLKECASATSKRPELTHAREEIK